ncbi:hypothetical protein SAMN04488498_101398 [Mesorhizobium albiziae]|uniref:Uncharacterized protein n=1 Tax=Neomesorhizobium albiziae TaxID=335020 RepID=A0A1I3VEH3_9HYPH|nr:hypothetical protein [Mesorhizobium albiziae]GLS28856.1 hypothetical protein GCM10007937_05630 [Mesorhizobium albiziae]SFJ93665.1 hypothetical protein SAMN04488498_101398 [Mesorhizobium albiziae]
MAARIEAGDEVLLRLEVVRVDPSESTITVVFGNGIRVTMRDDSKHLVEVIKQAKPRGRKAIFDKLD